MQAISRVTAGAVALFLCAGAADCGETGTKSSKKPKAKTPPTCETVLVDQRTLSWEQRGKVSVIPGLGQRIAEVTFEKGAKVTAERLPFDKENLTYVFRVTGGDKSPVKLASDNLDRVFIHACRPTHYRVGPRPLRVDNKGFNGGDVRGDVELPRNTTIAVVEGFRMPCGTIGTLCDPRKLGRIWFAVEVKGNLYYVTPKALKAGTKRVD